MMTEFIDCASHDVSAVATKYEHVMLVDDDPVHNIVSQKLIEKGCFASKTTQFESAVEALDFLSKASVEDVPSILFLDVVMPKMDGFAFLDGFSKLPIEVTSKCKVILLSSSESFEHLNKANKNRLVRKFLNKPLTPEILNAINI
jgi:CheY-like chemotaxis protein